MNMDKLRTDAVEFLLGALIDLDTKDEAYALLQDLCTTREIQEMSQRLEVARMLDAGDSYLNIQHETGASATTISRVSKCLNFGSDGYRKALDSGNNEITQ